MSRTKKVGIALAIILPLAAAAYVITGILAAFHQFAEEDRAAYARACIADVICAYAQQHNQLPQSWPELLATEVDDTLWGDRTWPEDIDYFQHYIDIDFAGFDTTITEDNLNQLIICLRQKVSPCPYHAQWADDKILMLLEPPSDPVP